MAFVEFHDPAWAEEAIRRFNNRPFQGRSLVVIRAHPRAWSGRPEAGVGATPPPVRKGDRAVPDGTTAAPPGRGAPRARAGCGPASAGKAGASASAVHHHCKGPTRERQSGQFFGG
jgi:RNA recognition motif-containing protein